MKKSVVVQRFAAIVALALANAAVFAQTSTAPANAGGAPEAPVIAPDAAPETVAAAKLPRVEIEKLVAPIALYPDVLIAQILPAATFPMDLVMAARWLRTKPDIQKVLEQPWDPSILSLCHYPEVIYKLDADLDWTNALGAAFLDQQPDVMSAIQNLRAMAKAAGALETNKQQTIIAEEQTIRIVPTEPQVVYVPQYNPQVIYVEDDDDDDYYAAAAVTASALSFTAGLAMGAWLDNDCDWHSHGVVYCQPGYWGGYARIHGPTAVAWGNSWAAAVGPRRAGVVGPNGGAYVGPRGAAVWGDNGYGAAWRRGSTAARPAYTGRYSGYNSYGGNAAAVNRGQINSGNRAVNINNSNNVNIDRGDRNTNINRGGDRSNVSVGNRANTAGGNRANVSGGSGARVSTRDVSQRSAYSSSSAASARQASNRGQQSRPATRSATPQRSQSTPRSSSNVQRSSSSSGSRSSAYSGSGSASRTKAASSRGSSSRGSASRGGGRGGGGRR